MTLAPAIEEFLAANAAPPAHLDVAEQRQYMRLLIDLNFLRFGARGPDVGAIVDHHVPVPGGSIVVRVYRPSAERRTGGISSAAPLPAHVSLHGGGWWSGSIDELVADALFRQRCVEARCVVIGVEYRLGPEHPFPVPLDDAYRALLWVAANAGRLGVDPHNISIGGSSAGANLAAAVALRVRDEGGLELVLQLLEVPALDLTGAQQRATTAAGGLGDLDQVDLVAAQRYVETPEQLRSPLVSPLLAADLSGLPPAQILTAELDSLRGDGEAYARRITAAGGRADAVRYPGALHGSAMLTRTWPAAAAWQRDVTRILRTAHWPTASDEESP